MNSGRKVFVLSLVIVFILLAVNVFGATYNCHNCTNCTATINAASAGDTINLIANITTNAPVCIPYGTSNTTFDCLNNKITGSGGTGISVINKNNVTIQNCDINNFTTGIDLLGTITLWVIPPFYSGTEHDIHNCDIYNNTYGIRNKNITNSTFYNNNIFNNTYGIHTVDGTGFDIANDYAFNFGNAVKYHNYIYDSEIYNNTYGIYGNDAFIHSVYNNNIYDNTDGVKIHNSGFWYIYDNKIYDNYVGVNLTQSGIDYLIFFAFVILDINITDNNITNNTYGIYGSTTKNLNIFSNNISYNTNDGMNFDASTFTFVQNNYVCFNNQIVLTFLDINFTAFGGNGQNNTCDNTVNWADAGVASGCFNRCTPYVCPINQSNPILNSSNGTDTTNENLTLYNQSLINSNKSIISWNVNGSALQLLNLPFDLNTSPVKDYSGRGNNGTNINAVWDDGTVWGITGWDGYATYLFFGSFGFPFNGHIDVTSSDLDLNLSDFTVSFWYQQLGFVNGVMLSKGINFEVSEYNNIVEINMTDFVNNITLRGGNLSFPGPYLNGWNHITIVADRNGNLSLYFNGVLANSTNMSSIGSLFNPNPFTIGCDAFSLSCSISAIDDVVVYNKALTSQQIALLPTITNNVIVSQETSNGDTWQGCIEPHNTICDGPRLCSNNLVIGGGPGPISPYCNNCSECNNLLNIFNGSGNITYLNASVLSNGTCINATGIVNLTFDCQNNVITGNGSGYGVLIDNNYNFTLQNCEINNFTTSILDINGNLNNLFSNTLQYSSLGLGIGSTGTLAVQNNIDYNDEGVNIIGNGAILDSNNIRNNDKDGLNASGNNLLVNTNYICFNNQDSLNYYDIDNASAGGIGDNNTCQLFNNWQDTSATSGCVNLCVAPTPTPRKISSGGGGGSYTSLKMYVDVKGGYAGDFIYVDTYNYYNKPLFNAKISVYKNGELITSANTGAEGSTYFKVNELGLYEIKITKAGYNPTSVNINLEKKSVREAPKILQESTPEIIPEIKEIVKPVFQEPVQEIKPIKQEIKEGESEIKLETKKVKTILFPIIIFSLLIVLVLGIAVYEIVKHPAKKITDKINQKLESADKLLRKIK